MTLKEYQHGCCVFIRSKTGERDAEILKRLFPDGNTQTYGQ